MKIIYMAVTLNLLQQLGEIKLVKYIVEHSILKTTKSGIQYFILNDEY